jgi:hypothetical protein
MIVFCDVGIRMEMVRVMTVLCLVLIDDVGG